MNSNQIVWILGLVGGCIAAVFNKTGFVILLCTVAITARINDLPEEISKGKCN